MKLEEIVVPDPEGISPEFWARAGAIAIVLVLLAVAWSRPVLRYGMIGALLFAGFLLVAKQGGGL